MSTLVKFKYGKDIGQQAALLINFDNRTDFDSGVTRFTKVVDGKVKLIHECMTNEIDDDLSDDA